MKNKSDVIFALFVVGVILITLNDKIFKRKNSTLKDKILEEPKYDKPNNQSQNLTDEDYKAIKLELERVGKSPKLDDIIQTDKGMFKYTIIQVGGIMGIKQDWVRYLPEGALK